MVMIMNDKYWYLIITEECPVCGKSSVTRVRMYTEKPKDISERYNFNHVYDYCMEIEYEN
jgi:hypothetical protein